MEKIPFNAVSILNKDDSGKRVVVNSVGGAIQNTKGIVLYGPHIYWYNAMTKKDREDKKQNAKMVKKKFETCPLWCVLLNGYNLKIRFMESEIEFT